VNGILNCPKILQTHDEQGDFKVMIKKQNMIYPYIMQPILLMPLVGMVTFILLAFSIHNYEPITGQSAYATANSPNL
jgi:homogentisate 1,2-dioxygenase